MTTRALLSKRGCVGGGTALLAVILAALVGPPLRADVPADQQGAALLSPLTTVTVVTLADGRALVSPRVDASPDQLKVYRDRWIDTVDRRDVLSVSRYRFWLGSDRFGRDVLTRLLLGGRLSLAVAAMSLLIALGLGCTIGIAAASRGGIVDTVLMRFVDAVLAFPIVLLLILAVTMFEPGPHMLVLILGGASWMSLSRLVRGQVLSLRHRPFILASRAAGTPWHRRWLWHYAPNLAGPVSQDAALRMADLVLAEATLSFLGLGIPPTSPSWGGMIADARHVIPDAWWLAVAPGLALVVVISSLAAISDGIQDLAAGPVDAPEPSVHGMTV